MTASWPILPEQPRAPARLFLIGMMGSGKSLAGHKVAARLGWPWVDSDQQIEHRLGKTVAQIFSTDGEAAFRAEESRALAEAATREPPVVVSVAGGAVLAAANRQLLRHGGLVVWLRASVETLATRTAHGDHRPLLQGDRAARLARLYDERRPLYQDLADVTVDVDHLSPDEVADRIVAAWHAGRPPSLHGGRRGARGA